MSARIRERRTNIAAFDLRTTGNERHLAGHPKTRDQAFDDRKSPAIRDRLQLVGQGPHRRALTEGLILSENRQDLVLGFRFRLAQLKFRRVVEVFRQVAFCAGVHVIDHLPERIHARGKPVESVADAALHLCRRERNLFTRHQHRRFAELGTQRLLDSHVQLAIRLDTPL